MNDKLGWLLVMVTFTFSTVALTVSERIADSVVCYTSAGATDAR